MLRNLIINRNRNKTAYRHRQNYKARIKRIAAKNRVRRICHIKDKANKTEIKLTLRNKNKNKDRANNKNIKNNISRCKTNRQTKLYLKIMISRVWIHIQSSNRKKYNNMLILKQPNK